MTKTKSTQDLIFFSSSSVDLYSNMFCLILLTCIYRLKWMTEGLAALLAFYILQLWYFISLQGWSNRWRYVPVQTHTHMQWEMLFLVGETPERKAYSPWPCHLLLIGSLLHKHKVITIIIFKKHVPSLFYFWFSGSSPLLVSRVTIPPPVHVGSVKHPHVTPIYISFSI